MHYKYHLTVIHGKSEYSYKGPVISLMRSSNEVTINVIITITITIVIITTINITITPNEVTILLILIVAVASLLGILELCHQPLNHHDMGS